MPLFEFTFTDTSTIQVLSDDAVAAKAHVDKLLTRASVLDDKTDPYYGKALASTTPRVVDKYKEREAQNKLLRG